jgi:MGT family glycosyltransferase
MPHHLAFAIMPAHGHVNPTLPLVEELTRRGHRVSYLTGAAWQGPVEAAGAEFVPVPDGIPAGGPPPNFKDGLNTVRSMLERFLGAARETVPETLRALQADPPDALFYDMLTWSARAAAEKAGVPAVQLFPSFASNEHFSLLSRFAGDVDLQSPELDDVREQFAEFGRSTGAAVAVEDVFAPRPQGLNLVFLPRQFQLRSETFDDRFVFLGPSLGVRPEFEQWQPPASGAPVLFVSLGTGPLNENPEFFRTAVRALGGSRWHVAMAVGDRVDVAELGEIPDNFEVRQYFPQPTVLKYATAFLSHAGMNSTMESLYNEVPMITVPQMPEQEANADRVEELGLGGRLREITAEQLRALVDEVSADESVRARLAEIGPVVRGCGGAELGADAVEKYLAGL